MLNNKKITITYLLILAISEFLSKTVPAIDVEVGNTIIFKAKNLSEGSWLIEGVKIVGNICKLDFIINLNKNFPAVINPAYVDKLAFNESWKTDQGNFSPSNLEQRIP